MTASEDLIHAKGDVSPDGLKRDAEEAPVIVEQLSAGRGRTATALDPIASALRRLHEDVASEPIPDDFLTLLASIDEKREGRPS